MRLSIVECVGGATEGEFDVEIGLTIVGSPLSVTPVTNVTDTVGIIAPLSVAVLESSGRNHPYFTLILSFTTFMAVKN